MIGDKGLTLVELLVALTIAGIVSGAIVRMFTSMAAGAVSQGTAAGLQQSIRAVADLMGNEIRMAGFTSRNRESFGIVMAEPHTLAFTVDWDDDGLVTASHAASPEIARESDIISYWLDPDEHSLVRTTASGTGQESTQPLLGGAGDHLRVTGLEFAYYDAAGRQTATPEDVRSVAIAIEAEYPAGIRGTVRRGYTSFVSGRNLGM